MAMPAVPPLVKRALVLLRQDALVAEEVPVLPRVEALVCGLELLGGLPPDAQPLASLLADLCVRAIGGRLLIGTGQHEVTAVTPPAELSAERA
jgi:hypothetical protein